MNFTSKDGTKIYYKKFHELDNSDFVLVLIHGMGEHLERYSTHFAQFFKEKNVAVMAMDHRGHGQSEGQRGHTDSLDIMLDDVAQFLEICKQTYPGKKIVMYGHSMGGNIVSNFVIRRKPDIACFVGSAPYYKLAFEPPKIKLFLGNYVGRLLPKLSQPTGLNPEHISRDKAIVEAYKKDPLVHSKISAGFFNNVHYAGLEAIERASEINVKGIIIHGTADKLTSIEGSRQFVDKSGGKASFKAFEGLYHELHNEPEKYEVLEYVYSEIKACL